MNTAKQAVEKMVHELPDDCSFEDIQYHLYVMKKIQLGLEDIKEGRVVPHAEVVTMLKSKIKKWTM